jgi:hypothetical protein
MILNLIQFHMATISLKILYRAISSCTAADYSNLDSGFLQGLWNRLVVEECLELLHLKLFRNDG